MNTDGFWEIIDGVHQDSGGDMDTKCELLRERLTTLSDDDLRGFIEAFYRADADAYTWPLWGAAYVIGGGCSDDAFSDFRASLISLGRSICEAALADPDSLADHLPEDPEELFYEGFQYAHGDIAEKRFGAYPERTVPFPREPSGAAWDEDDVEKLYPRLAAEVALPAPPSGDERPPAKPWWKFW